MSSDPQPEPWNPKMFQDPQIVQTGPNAALLGTYDANGEFSVREIEFNWQMFAWAWDGWFPEGEDDDRPY